MNIFRKPKDPRIREKLLGPLLKRLSHEPKFLQLVLEIRIAAIDKATRDMPETPLDIIASQLLPEIGRFGLNYHEVMGLFTSAAIFKMMNDRSGNVTMHPFEMLASPETCDHWLEKGRIIAGLGFYNNALKCIEKALSINPKRADVWSEKGDILFKFAKTLSPTAKFSENQSNPLTLSRLSGETERYEEALQCFEQAISLDPKCVSAYFSKGSCLVEIGRPTQDFSKVLQAIKCFETVLKLDPSHKNAKTTLEMYRKSVLSR